MALGGGVVALGCGAGALGVSAGIAQRLNEAKAGTKSINDAGYDALNFAFVALGICAGVSTAAAVGGGIVGALE